MMEDEIDIDSIYEEMSLFGKDEKAL